MALADEPRTGVLHPDVGSRQGGVRVEERDPLLAARTRGPPVQAGGHQSPSRLVQGSQRSERRHRLGRVDVCVGPLQIAADLEQCVQMLVTGEEICLGASEERAIMLGPRVVGYIRIVDECAWARGAASRR